MITKTAERLFEIEHDIKVWRVAANTDQVPYSLARKKVQDLENERERLWANQS